MSRSLKLERDGEVIRIPLRELSSSRAASEMRDVMMALDVARKTTKRLDTGELDVSDFEGASKRYNQISEVHRWTEGAKGYTLALYLADQPLQALSSKEALVDVGLRCWNSLLEQGYSLGELHAMSDMLRELHTKNALGSLVSRVNVELDFSDPQAG